MRDRAVMSATIASAIALMTATKVLAVSAFIAVTQSRRNSASLVEIGRCLLALFGPSSGGHAHWIVANDSTPQPAVL